MSSRPTDCNLLISELKDTHSTVPEDTSKHGGDFRQIQRSHGTPSSSRWCSNLPPGPVWRGKVPLPEADRNGPLAVLLILNTDFRPEDAIWLPQQKPMAGKDIINGYGISSGTWATHRSQPARRGSLSGGSSG